MERCPEPEPEPQHTQALTQPAPHPTIPGLFLLPGPSRIVIDRILCALQDVQWQRSAGRATYSCGWEWHNADGGWLGGWRSPPAALREALALLQLPAVDASRSAFNQVIFNHYYEDTWTCGRCHQQRERNCFSQSQLRKPNGAKRICKACNSVAQQASPQLKADTLQAAPVELRQAMPAHTDRKELGPVVWGITLSGCGHLRFTRGSASAIVHSNAGEAYYMTGESRHKWAHQPFGLNRLSITIRAVPESHPNPRLKDIGLGRMEAEAAAQLKAAQESKQLRKAIMKVGKKLAEIEKLKARGEPLDPNQQAKVAQEPDLRATLTKLTTSALDGTQA